MLVKDFMKQNPTFCLMETPLQKVVQLMSENECDFVTVVESYTHKNPIGIVTEHDICLSTIGKGINPLPLSAGKVMNTNFEKVSVKSDAAKCSTLFSESGYSFLVVVDDKNACCGIVMKSNLPDEPAYNEFPSMISDQSSYRAPISYIDRIF